MQHPAGATHGSGQPQQSSAGGPPAGAPGGKPEGRPEGRPGGSGGSGGGRPGGRPQMPEKPDISEKGANGQTSDKRLYMQFRAYTGCKDQNALIEALKPLCESKGVEMVVYANATDERGVGIVTLSQEPADFVSPIRETLSCPEMMALAPLPEYTMFGRTYSIGYEMDLEDTLLGRQRRNVLNPDLNWSIWYPLRRSGKFELLSREEQMAILGEHGKIGMAYGAHDLAHDVRLACHGLDKSDNDFVIGLIGKELFPLSAVVQTMRKTQQTALYLTNLGPFFVGKVIWRSIEIPQDKH